MIRVFAVANLIRFRATRDGVQREFDSWAAAAKWINAFPLVA